MPCLFICNVPEWFHFYEERVVKLHQDLAAADNGAEVGSFEIHVETTRYKQLHPDGSTAEADNVHVFVEGFGRPVEVKAKIARLVHEFLTYHRIGEDSDITFRDSPAETFFFNGQMVPGGSLSRKEEK